jgi:hypothetical protein
MAMLAMTIVVHFWDVGRCWKLETPHHHHPDFFIAL